MLVSSTIYNCNATIDQAVYKNIAAWQGYSKTDYGTWNGIYTGKYQVLINVPLAIASSLAASSVPALSAAYASGKRGEAKRQIGLAHALSWSWHSRVQSEWACFASRFFRCCLVIPPSLRQECCRPVPVAIISSPVDPFQRSVAGMNRMKEPIKNAVIALALHLIILVALMLGLDLNIFAVIIANACFGLIMCILNARSIRRYSGYRREVRRTFFVPAVSAAGMGVVVWLVYRLFLYLLRSNLIATLVSIVAGVFTYATLLLMLKGLTEQEILRFPKGRTLVKLARKMHLFALIE